MRISFDLQGYFPPPKIFLDLGVASVNLIPPAIYIFLQSVSVTFEK